MLNGMLSQSKLVKGNKTKLNFNNTLSSKLDETKVYFCDLRTDKDKDFELEIRKKLSAYKNQDKINNKFDKLL